MGEMISQVELPFSKVYSCGVAGERVGEMVEALRKGNEPQLVVVMVAFTGHLSQVRLT